MILQETFSLIEQEIKIISDQTTDYTKEQLNRMIELFAEIHSKYPLGICVRKDIHNLYHKIYGTCGSTLEKWDKFESDFRSGKYNDVIKI